MIFSKLDKLGGREKTLLVVGLVFVLAALANQFVVQQIVGRLKELHAAIEIEEERLAYNTAVVESREQVEQVYEQVAAKLGETTTAASDIDLMKGQIDDLAIRSDLEIVETTQREPRHLPHYQEYVVDLAFQGTVQHLLRFLDAMQESGIPGLLAVDQLDVSVGRQEGTIKGNMTITKVAVDR